jgi:hypothetical protein
MPVTKLFIIAPSRNQMPVLENDQVDVRLDIFLHELFGYC